MRVVIVDVRILERPCHLAEDHGLPTRAVEQAKRGATHVYWNVLSHRVGHGREKNLIFQDPRTDSRGCGTFNTCGCREQHIFLSVQRTDQSFYDPHSLGRDSTKNRASLLSSAGSCHMIYSTEQLREWSSEMI